ncbi:MAG: bifunctional UDP-N-acetylmuramoyl-tripeptide:D-alanyl-D-alanine ligase/alanine racemase [Bacteroidales bacterium]
MPHYSLQQIASTIKGKANNKKNPNISHLLLDSRRLFSPDTSLFFALVGKQHNGHHYIAELYQAGVRAFVISQKLDASLYPHATFISVDDGLLALQTLAHYHRTQLTYPIIAITGSNGKTIVKEWLAQLLTPQIHIARSPKSYNSQVGVPLSLWGMEHRCDLGIVEAGISQTNEMQQLSQCIRPDIVIFTNLGDAHQEGFAARNQKLKEKLHLASQADAIIYCTDQHEVKTEITTTAKLSTKHNYTWGTSEQAQLRIINQSKTNNTHTITLLDTLTQVHYTLPLPFTDEASIQNALTAFTTCLYLAHQYPHLNLNLAKLSQQVAQLTPITMRLNLHEGINTCTIINDSYSADLASLRIALDFLASFGKHTQRTAILSDFEQSGKEAWRLYSEMAQMLHDHGITRLIAVGDTICKHRDKFLCETICYTSAEEMLRKFDRSIFHNEAILVKGSRNSSLEKIAQQLEQKTHLTVLEVNLSALTHNLKLLRGKLHAKVKTMVLVKAFAYGAGLCEIARLLQHQRIDYLGVAFTDEGVQLREAGITLPIIVLNPEPSAFEQIIEYNLEPEIYNLSMLQGYSKALLCSGESMGNIHLKLDTGMHRLGFMSTEVDNLLKGLKACQNLRVSSIFSHLAAADEPAHDTFTLTQITEFEQMSQRIIQQLGYPPLLHIANSAATERFPQAQFDMVRLGISFYGASATGIKHIRPVSTLKTTIVQIKQIAAGASIGYGRKGQVSQPKTIAIIPIGYADGFNRSLSNGAFSVMIKGQLAPTIGNICMDTAMIDITHIKHQVQEGDEVIIFGEKHSVQLLAHTLHTIPYEVFTRLSTRVKRVYFSE